MKKKNLLLPDGSCVVLQNTVGVGSCVLQTGHGVAGYILGNNIIITIIKVIKVIQKITW